MKTNPEHAMDNDRFRELAETYGSSIARWPASERQAAEAFVARFPEVALVLDEQRALDERLDALAPIEPSAALLRAVAEVPLRHEHRASTGAFWPFARLRALIAIAAAAAAMGAAVGMITPDRAPVAEADQGWDDLTSLAFAQDLSEEMAP